MSTAKKRASQSQAPAASPSGAAPIAEAEGAPLDDEAAAKAAFEKLASWYGSLPQSELRPIDVDPDQAAAAALSLSKLVRDDQLSAKFHAVPSFFFDATVLDHLPLAARGLWYASRQRALAPSGSADEARWAAIEQRAWSFLLGTYAEVAETGFWLERGNKRRDELFPDLRAAARSRGEGQPSPGAPPRSGERPTPP